MSTALTIKPSNANRTAIEFPHMHSLFEEMDLHGTGPSDVATLLRKMAVEKQIPYPLKSRRSILLGSLASGAAYTLAFRGQRLLIAGETKSGKSWAGGLFAEQLILLGYAMLIIDPEGDYISLEALPGVVVYGGADPLPRPRDLIRALRHADISVVIDLSHTTMADRYEYVHNLLVSLRTLREGTGLPHYILLDEAHYFFPRSLATQTVENLHLESTLLITYRASLLHPALLQQINGVLLTRESEPKEMQTIAELCGLNTHATLSEHWWYSVANLDLGEAISLPINQLDNTICRFKLIPRLTPHIRHVAKYIDIPVPTSEQFVFWDGDTPSGRTAKTLSEFVDVLKRETLDRLAMHLLHHDFSRWIADIFGDYPLARSVELIEHEYQEGKTETILDRITSLIQARYEIVDPLRLSSSMNHA